MPVVIFFACLDLEEKSSFMDGHYLNMLRTNPPKFGGGLKPNSDPREIGFVNIVSRKSTPREYTQYIYMIGMDNLF
jgi:hypothetical protein